MKGLKKLILIGGGGTTGDVISLISAINKHAPTYEILGLLDDTLPKESICRGLPVLGTLQDNTSFNDEVYFVDCLGSTRSYQKREFILKQAGFKDTRFATIIHPSVVISDDTQIGIGSILFPNVVVLSNVKIGAHVTILSGSVLNHDVVIKDWSIIASGVMVSGSVKIGRACYLGAACSIREGVQVHDGSLIGMGAVVINDVAANQVAVGVPARALRSAI